MRSAIISAAVLSLLVGCGTNQEAFTPYCEETRTDISLTSADDLGFSPQDVLDAVERTYEHTLTWEDGTTTALTIEVTYAGGATRFVDSEEAPIPEDAGAVNEIAVFCEDSLSIDVNVHFSTADGAFDESWTVALSALTADAASFTRDLDPARLTGDYDYMTFNPADYDAVAAYVSANLSAAGSEGEIVETAELVEGEGDDATASQSAHRVASWPDAE